MFEYFLFKTCSSSYAQGKRKLSLNLIAKFRQLCLDIIPYISFNSVFDERV